MKPFPPFGEENLWRLIGNLHRFPDPENDKPTQDRSVQLFSDYYRLPSFQGFTCGWLKTYHDLVFTVTQFDPGLRDLYQSKQEAIFSQHVKSLADKALGLFTASFEETLENVIAWQDEERNQSSWSQADEDLFFQHTWSVFALGNYHPERTSRGARVPYVQKNGLQFGFLELDPDTFPVSCPPAQYWPRMGLSITPRWVGEMVGASDAPVSTKQDPRFPQAHSVEQTLEQADKLLNAAYDDKRRVIPTGAIVQLKFGLFHSFEVHEVRHEIGFVARTHTGEFSLLYFQHEEGKWKFWWPSGFAFDGKATQSNSPVVAALKHVLAAAVHDFWTLDERTFAEIFVPQNPKKVPGLRNRKTPEGAPRIVYLPQIVYTGKPNLKHCEESLELTARTRHRVTQHLRQSSSCSEKALLLASQYGMAIPQGYTFVQPHWRGHETDRPTIYRSRSALKCLYTLQGTTIAHPSFGGQLFLNIVRDALERQGHTILSISNQFGLHYRAVDIRSFHDDVSWIIQVKEKGPGSRVGRDEVKEFVDLLPPGQNNTRGVIVTNTGYTNHARECAEDRGIHLLTGPPLVFPQ